VRKLISTILRWLRLLTTSRDNQTPDVIRIGAILIGTQFIVNACWALLVLGQPWDPNAYGLGAGLILTATGAALGFKRKDEPDA
jgi:hypothetical protein